MLLNIIFGIVIDTFAQQRDLQKQIKEDMDNICFVCGIDRNTFDRKHPQGFDWCARTSISDASLRPTLSPPTVPSLRHIRNEHNLWHYLAFMVHLRVKRATEYTGPESFVKQMLDKKDLTFFPILRTSSITVEDSVSNEHVLERVEALARTVLEGNERVEELLAKMSEGEGGPQ